MNSNDARKPDSISVGDMSGSAFTIGNQNEVSIQFQKASVPDPETIDIQAELQAFKTLLLDLNQDQNDPVVAGAIQKIEQESQKEQPDKNVVGKALKTGLEYAEDLNGFANSIDKLRPHVEAVAGWLGKHGHKLLPLVGLM